LIEKREPTKSAWIPVAQFRFPSTGERHPKMYVLRMFDLRRWEQQQARHAQFGYEITRGLFLYEPKDHALPIAINLLQHRSRIPRKR
jgi:hypothetical protein